MTDQGPVWESAADVVVVGTGVAGLTTALDAAQAGLRVLVVTKAAAGDGNTSWAQGGVAVVRSERDAGDSPAAHIRDTLVAGAGLCDPEAVAVILNEGPAAIARLQARGARFDTGPAGLARTREGGHSANRVIHAGGDATGAEIERALLAAPGRPVLVENQLALDVVSDPDGNAAGVLVLADDGTVGLIRAGAVVLATGGSGHLFAATTNPAVATGDGLAMALRAGASVGDLEFVQFHPTVLWTGPHAVGHRPLVTEAVRGEGAVLIDATGARIMTGVHPLADLAPRDVVSLAVTRRLAQAPGGVGDHVFLDATGIPADRFARRFPTVTAACLAAGIDPGRQPIPVAPAAHYQCGGVLTDLSGCTEIPGLYAVGEVARTGLHGANRLASNSLLEGLVMGARTARALRRRSGSSEVVTTATDLDDPSMQSGRQAAMSRLAGIGRSDNGLRDALIAMKAAPSHTLGRAQVEAANLRLASTAVLTAALERTESRGCHVRLDHPQLDPEQARTLTVRLVDGRFALGSAHRVAALV